MAQRRMFSKTIIDSDAFLDMSTSAQALYFHLAMRADDDGFINNPKKIQRMVGAADDDLRILIAKRFILIFESGVIVIKHWQLHNYIRKDRYTETLYQGEKSLLYVKKNGAYTDHPGDGKYKRLSSGQPTDNQRLTQVRLGKVRLGKVSRSSGESGGGDMTAVREAATGAGLPWHPANQNHATALVGKHGLEWVLMAIDRTTRRDKQNWGVVSGILDSWQAQGQVDEPGLKPAADDTTVNWVARDGD